MNPNSFPHPENITEEIERLTPALEDIKAAKSFIEREIYGLVESECAVIYEAMRSDMETQSVSHPFDYYNVQLFSDTVADAITTSLPLTLHLSPEMLERRGFHAGFLYPNELHLHPYYLLPQTRLKAYMFGIPDLLVSTEEEAIVHELRHQQFQHYVEEINVFNPMDEAFALATDSVASFQNIATTLTRRGAYDATSAQIVADYHKAFLTYQALGLDDLALLKFLQSEGLGTEDDYVGFRPKSSKAILQMIYSHAGISDVREATEILFPYQELKYLQKIKFRIAAFNTYNRINSQIRDLVHKREREERYRNL